MSSSLSNASLISSSLDTFADEFFLYFKTELSSYSIAKSLSATDAFKFIAGDLLKSGYFPLLSYSID